MTWLRITVLNEVGISFQSGRRVVSLLLFGVMIKFLQQQGAVRYQRMLQECFSVRLAASCSTVLPPFSNRALRSPHNTPQRLFKLSKCRTPTRIAQTRSAPDDRLQSIFQNQDPKYIHSRDSGLVIPLSVCSFSYGQYSTVDIFHEAELQRGKESIQCPPNASCKVILR